MKSDKSDALNIVMSQAAAKAELPHDPAHVERHEAVQRSILGVDSG